MPRDKVVDPAWMTYEDACPLLGVSHTKVRSLVVAGRIRAREQVWRAWPSLWRADVERVAVDLAEERTVADTRRSARPLSAPPDDEHVWLTVTEAGLVLQMTPGGVLYRAKAGLLPHERRGRRVWFRREHVEQAAAARAFRGQAAAAKGAAINGA